MQILKIKIKPKVDRLDQVVSSLVKSLTRAKSKKLINEGHILVNDHQVEPSYRVGKGDRIKVEIPATPQISLKAQNIPLKIVYEDSDILVIDKPAGLVVHPTLDHPTGTLVNALLGHLKERKKEDLRPGIVHRLDKDTSGLLVVGKTLSATENLKKQFKARTVTKKYIALASGEVEKETGLIDKKIARHPKFRSKFVAGGQGREAQTEYKVLRRFKSMTLLELKPLTGRTHQLRVHLTSIGYPIVGDKLYGGRALLDRQFLHASFLAFTHPATFVKLEFESKLPEDLATFLKKQEPK
ncbi:MAG TPA: RluA family pseudouridine synthase [Candidatus Nanoarchaeia archaeon]|nr:ribosomal large subunit pseudouridine synthase D [uncultured archaeon]